MNKSIPCKGFGLIEIIIAIFIVSIGVLAVGKLETQLLVTSADNKARSEALSLAQKRIEDLRNYFLKSGGSPYYSSDTFVTKFEIYIDTLNSSETDIVGTNATFKRSTTVISGDDDLVEFEVKVFWTNAQSVNESVSLRTDIIYSDLAMSGNNDKEPEEKFIDEPTGRAFVGQGELGDYTNADCTVASCNNGDGTSSYAVDPDSDVSNLLLVLEKNDDGKQDVVLTLEDACERFDLDDEDSFACTDFVKISGRIYIHEDYTLNDPANIFVLASDAAYCSRYYSGGTIYNSSTVKVTELDSAGSEYFYFNYTCYLGGGWYGNIGLLFDNYSAKQLSCIGDPSNSKNTVLEATRRSYRGMVWRYDESDETKKPIPYKDGDKDVEELGLDALKGDVRYHSWGIADASNLSTQTQSPFTTHYNNVEHNFFIGEKKNPSLVDCDDLASIDISLWNDNNDAFFCLNELVKINEAGVSKSFLLDLEDGVEYSNLDNLYFEKSYYDDSGNEYKNEFDTACAYDPSDYPDFVYKLNGVIEFEDMPSSFVAGASTKIELFESIFDVQTSQGLNCYATDATYSVLTDGLYDFIFGSSGTGKVYFSCKIYDSGTVTGKNKFVADGWDGTVNISPIDFCTSGTGFKTFSDLTADQVISFTCKYNSGL